MRRQRFLILPLLFVCLLQLNAITANANNRSEYKQVVAHLKTKYRAKKVKIPFVWLARFAVSVVKPAGVKSFSVTLFEDLQMSRDGIDSELAAALDRTFSGEWSPVFRVRSRDGQQVYMYMREAGKNIRLTLVTIDKQQAAVIRATFSPEKLVEFTNDPKIFGISLDHEEKDEKPDRDRTPAENN